MNPFKEREAGAHNQWRRIPTGSDDWREGQGGSNAPSLGERGRAKLSRPPL